MAPKKSNQAGKGKAKASGNSGSTNSGARGRAAAPRARPCNHACRDTCVGHTCCAESRVLLAARAAADAAAPAENPGPAAATEPSTANRSRKASKAAGARKRKRADAEVVEAESDEENNRGNDNGNAEQPEDAAAPATGPSATGGSGKARRVPGGRKRRRAETDATAADPDNENDDTDAAQLEAAVAPATGPPAATGPSDGRKRRRADREVPEVQVDKQNDDAAVEQPAGEAERADDPAVPQVLAVEEQITDITIKSGDARLTVCLQVSLDDTTRTRLANHTRFYISYDMQGDENDRVQKPNAKASWIKDILTPKASRGKSEISETAQCLQALFDKNGKVSAKITDVAVRKSLEEDSLIFIGMIYFEDGFRGKGLLAPAFDVYYAMLGQLPEWFAFVGSIVLVPAKPVEYGAAWGKKSNEEVEKTLIGTYEKAGYARWVTADVPVGPGVSNRIVVMGRSVQ